MGDPKTKTDPQFKCNQCDKPYVKKGALTNHMSKVHLILKSPEKKSYMDISTSDKMETEKTFMADIASKKDTEMKQEQEAAADELEVMQNMNSLIDFESSILTSPVLEPKTADIIKVQN